MTPLSKTIAWIFAGEVLGGLIAWASQFGFAIVGPIFAAVSIVGILALCVYVVVKETARQWPRNSKRHFGC